MAITEDRQSRYLLALVLVLFAASMVYGYLLPRLDIPADSSRYQVLTEGQILVAPTVDVQQAGTPVSFPLHWRHQFQDTNTVWYQFDLSKENLAHFAGNEEMLGLFIGRVNQTVDVWFNGVQVGSGGDNTVRHWNSPLFFTVPSGLISDNNTLLIRHFAYHGWGSMEPPVLGTHSELRGLYETRYLMQHDASIGLFVFVALTGLFCLAVWYYGRREPEYLWFAVASLGTSVYCANQFVRYLWVNPDLWRWMINVSTDLWGCATAFVILRSLQIQQPTFERLTIGYFLLGLGVYAYATLFKVFDLNIYFHLGTIVIIAYTAYLALQDYLNSRRLISAFFCLMLSVGLAAGIHDSVLQAVLNVGWSAEAFHNRFNLLQFVAPAGFLLMGVSLIQRYMHALRTADSLNAELEEKISEAKQELEESYLIMQDALMQQSASEERERIYRDLHDDVGSKLLSLYYRLEDQNNSTLAKSALEDLRDIVSRKTMENCTLSAAVQQWQVEAFSRTRDANVTLDWQFTRPETDFLLDESQHAQLRRMLREVFSNAILHNPGLKTMGVQISVALGHLIIAVENDGVSDGPNTWEPGRGISNLRLRARELQGRFEIEEVEPGKIRVSWAIPLNTTPAQGN